MSYSVFKYFTWDYPSTLFPLDVNRVVIEGLGSKLLDHIYQKVVNSQEKDHRFLPQTRVFAAKRGFHLRPTVKLDPIAELYIYDVVYRNRSGFRKDFSDTRRSYGYRFVNGEPISASQGYAAYKKAVSWAKNTFKFGMALDVSAYFNSIYHHDLVNHARISGWDDTDVDSFGLFLREVNSGRSIDCLPQGLHPCKLLGADFLRFVDDNGGLASDMLIRFLDDIHIFGTNADRLTRDFLSIQELLSRRGLQLNSAKTIEDAMEQEDVASQVDDIKASLLQQRRIILSHYFDEEVAVDEDQTLTSEQIDYLLTMLMNPTIDEADAELVLVLLRDYGEQVLQKMTMFLHRFPSLSKSIYNYARHSENLEELDDLLLSFLKDSPNATEYQLFWMTKLAQDFLSNSDHYGEFLWAAYDHQNATVISRAKVLEIPEHRFGLPDLRQEHLRTGKSDWESWASAVGCRNEPPAGRNHVLDYFANGSSMNRVIVDAVKSAPLAK